MRARHYIAGTLASFLSLGFSPSDALCAPPPLDPATFDKNSDGLLNEEELKSYLVKRDKLTPDFSVIMTEDFHFKGNVQSKEAAEILIQRDLIDQASNALAEMLEHFASESPALKPPFTIADVRKIENLIVASNGTLEQKRRPEETLTIPGLFGAQERNDHSSFGPLLLRKNAESWYLNLSDAPGATVSFSYDRLSQQKSWNSEGAFIYPISFSNDNTRVRPESSIRSESWQARPSLSWNHTNISNGPVGDVQELQMNLPLVWSANHVNLGWLRHTELTLSPYFLTDFSFKGALEGISFSYTPYLFDSYSGFALNTGYKGLGSSVFMYRCALVPSLDYNHQSDYSRYIVRNNSNNYFRVGAKAELGFRTLGFPALEVLGSYHFLSSISGALNHTDLIELNAKLWLNKFAGLGFEYKKGKTPLTDKDVNMTTIGPELRF